MAVFDLKKCDLFITDGYANTLVTGTVTGAVTAGATSITINTTTAPTAGGLLICGKTRAVIVSHTGTSGAYVVTLATGVVEALLGGEAVSTTGVYNAIELKVGDGTLTWDAKHAREYLKNRGKIDEVRDGDEEPMDVSSDFWLEYITGTTGSPTLTDVFEHTGDAADWVSADSDSCAPHAVNIELHYKPTCGQWEFITLPFFRHESLKYDAKAGKVSLTGKCNALKPVSVRI